MKRLKQDYPSKDFCFVLGADLIDSLKAWQIATLTPTPTLALTPTPTPTLIPTPTPTPTLQDVGRAGRAGRGRAAVERVQLPRARPPRLRHPRAPAAQLHRAYPARRLDHRHRGGRVPQSPSPSPNPDAHPDHPATDPEPHSKPWNPSPSPSLGPEPRPQAKRPRRRQVSSSEIRRRIAKPAVGLRRSSTGGGKAADNFGESEKHEIEQAMSSGGNFEMVDGQADAYAPAPP